MIPLSVQDSMLLLTESKDKIREDIVEQKHCLKTVRDREQKKKVRIQSFDCTRTFFIYFFRIHTAISPGTRLAHR